MIMYYQTKLYSKRISYSEDIIETVIFDHTSLSCDRDIENSKRMFLHDNPAPDDASQYQVWYQNAWRFRRHHLDKHRHFNPSLWLNLNAVILLFHKTLRPIIAYHQTKFGGQSQSYFDHMSPRCVLKLEDSKTCLFRMTAVCVSLHWSGGLHVVRLLAGSWNIVFL